MPQSVTKHKANGVKPSMEHQKLQICLRRINKRPASIEEVKAYVQQRGEILRAYIQRWSIIKNSAVEVSDERAIDAFIVGL
jgi:hypothetical protein